MPTPGADSIETALVGFTIEVKPESGDTPAITTQFNKGPVSTALAAGIHSGWTCATPTATSTMATTIAAAFSGMAAGQGLAAMIALGTAIDAETASWASSWNAVAQVHGYSPSSEAIKATAIAASPVKSPAMTALSERVANVFIASFEQEVG